MEPELPPCLQECCQEVRQAEEEVVLCHLHLEGYQGCRQVQQERIQRSPTIATRMLVLPRELPKDTIYIYKATKAVDKYSRRGYKEVRQWRQEGSCCPESCPRTPSTWLPRLSTSTAGEATKKSDNGDKKARAAQRGAQ